MIRSNSSVLMLTLLLRPPIETRGVPQSAESRVTHKTAPATSCPVTLPPAPTAHHDAMSHFEPGTSHWKPVLTLGPFGLWPEGTIVFRSGGPGSVGPDGALAMKFGWTREEGLRGKLKIHGRRLDAPAPPLRADIPDGYGETGFQATALIFPTEGCWEVTGEVADTRVTFVTRVVRG
jgi:hypothetical protein